MACVNATSEIKVLKEQLSSLEQHFSVQERDHKMLKEEQEEEKEKQAKQLREMSKEMLEWQEQCKLLESQKHDIHKKLTHLEEAYKRDTNIFR